MNACHILHGTDHSASWCKVRKGREMQTLISIHLTSKWEEQRPGAKGSEGALHLSPTAAFPVTCTSRCDRALCSWWMGITSGLWSCAGQSWIYVCTHTWAWMCWRERGQRQKRHDSLEQVGRAGAEKEQECVPRTAVLGQRVPPQQAVWHKPSHHIYRWQ